MTAKTLLLGEYVKVVGGYAFKSEEFTDEGIPVIRISDVQDGTVSVDKAVRIPEAVIGKGKSYYVKSGDILIAMSGATTGKIGVVPDKFDGLILQNQRVGNFKITRPEKLDKLYLRHFVSSPSYQSQIWKSMVGVAQPNISSKQLESFEIYLPPIAKQKRIAEILDRTQSLISKRKEAIAKLDTLTQSIFLEMFGDSLTNPKGWDIAKVGEIAEVQGGLQVSSSRKKYPREVPYLRVANVYRGFLNLSEIKMICATDTEISRTLLQKDDLLIVEGHGNPNEIGRVALWDGSIVNCIHQNHIIRARFDQSKIIPLYACHYLNSAGGRQHLLKSGKTTSGLNTISVSEVRSSPLSMPPLGLQKEFTQRVEAIEKLKATHHASLSQLEALFASLQHRAFRGEL